MTVITWLPLIFLWIIIFTSNRNHKILLKRITKNKYKSQQEKDEVTEALTCLIGKDSYIKMIDGNIEAGIIKEIVGKAVVVEDIKRKTTKSVNSDFIESVQEYPHNKKGKRATFIS